MRLPCKLTKCMLEMYSVCYWNCMNMYLYYCRINCIILQWHIQGFFLVARKPTPPGQYFFLNQWFYTILTPTFTSHFNLRVLEREKHWDQLWIRHCSSSVSKWFRSYTCVVCEKAVMWNSNNITWDFRYQVIQIIWSYVINAIVGYTMTTHYVFLVLSS